ncbi:SlyX family protein [Treponema sp. Marseille-Q3903]|uniref:SlyX family protein n=1 Tax=Treponema sp. Marseille-Q3903 TaxID=2766703 RepID=UPI001651CA23|nr:SlyX family protein [Treponema sp. Marseille-Q3903]MBC6714486.1 SlyX family protein [Treponema sp. Marseille-Q3903]
MDEQNLIKLEMKLAYLEDFLNQLQDVTVKQGKDIEKLKSENKVLKDKVKDLSDWAEGDIPDRKPPHY